MCDCSGGCNSGKKKPKCKPSAKKTCPLKKIISIKLTKFAFETDHKLLLDNNANWQGTGNRYPKPEWQEGRTNPSHIGISHTKSGTTSATRKRIDVTVSFEVTPPDANATTGKIKGTSSQTCLSFEGSVKLKGGTGSVRLTANADLPQVISTLKDITIKWKIVADGKPFDLGAVGKYTIYLTYGTPYNNTPYDNNPTENRMKWVCNTCDGQSDAHQSVKSIHDSTGSYNLSAGTPHPRWKIAGGAHAQCMDLSKFYMLASEMLGLKSGSVVYLFPKAGKTTKESTSSNDCEKRVISSSIPPHPTGTTHALINPNEEILLVDNQGGWNNFEACFKFKNSGITKYYAGGAGTYNTAQQVMEAVCDKTHWTYETGPNVWSICVTPGPSPIDNWP